MIKFFRLSPSRLALAYVVLSVLMLALFAIPLWHAWRANLSTFRAYVQGEDLQRLVEVFHSKGAQGLATAMESQARSLPGDEIMVFADASKLRLAGNLPAWPAEVPDAPGMYGLVIGLGGGSTMRVVASHVTLSGGYHLLMGRESVRFESLVDRFWYGLAGAMGLVLVLGAAFGWMIRRALLFEVHEISRTASAIVEGDLSRRVATPSGSGELHTLAQTVNGMLEQLARQNAQLEGEIAVRRQTEQALHRAHDDLEGLVAERTAELARANESLHRTETYLAEGQRLSHTGSWAFNVATRQIVHWSLEHFRIFGFDPEHGMPSFETFRRRIHPDDRAKAAEILERAVSERTGYELDCRIVLPDGAMKYIHAIGHPVFSASGNLVEAVGTVMDVTERKQAEDALYHAQAELAHVTRVAMLGEMSASIAHEINQPLTAVVNNASACLRWLAAPNLEAARESAARIVADGHRAGEIIGRIRAFVNKTPSRKDWVDINETIREVIALVRSEVYENRVSLQTQLSDDVPRILGDRIQLQQVILNLIINAIDAMNGISDAPRELLVGCAKDDSESVLVAVRDSGPGLDPGSPDRLFQAFYTTKPQGMGLGLAISRSIVEAHGGRLWATANERRGAVFQFTLPMGDGRAS
jgi:PAS domain S-box-containing protein